MDLIQDNGQPRFGRFSQQPSAISTERYIYKSPYGKVERGWRKKIKYKKFKFCSIQHQHYTLGVAIADIGWAGHGFFICIIMPPKKCLNGTRYNPLPVKHKSMSNRCLIITFLCISI